MARGFLAGAIWGLVVSGVGAGALSVAMGPPANRPAPPPPPIATDPVAEAVESRSARVAPATTAPDPDKVETSGSEVSTSQEVATEKPGPEEEASQAGAEMTPEAPAESPAVGAQGGSDAEAGEEEIAPGEASTGTEAADTRDATSDEAETPAVPPARRPSGEQGIEPASAGPALSAPEQIEGGAPDTRPTRRPDPIPAPLAPDAPGTSESARLAVGGDAPVQPGLPALPPQAPLAEERPALATDPAQPPQPAEDSGLVADPEGQAPAESAPEPVEEEVSEAPEEPRIAPEPAPRVTALVPERPAEVPQAERPSVGTPATSLIDRAPEKASDTTPAPGIGTASESRLPVITEEAEPAPAATLPAAADRPLQIYAADASLAPGEPAMSILLIDDGSGPLGPETVEAFPFPVSFAIAPEHPDPAGAAAAYRARGFEVLALADLPENATPADAEVSLEGTLNSVPEAVAVLEGANLALQHNRGVSEQAAEFLAASGHGLVMMPNGLNTAEALARRAGVPSLTIFRDFDGKGQDPRVMRRFLDQAAFRARQEDDVVMLGRLRADTVSALLLWGLQDRANSVALVPVSALLLRQEQDR